MSQALTTGRIVQYMDNTGKKWPAIVVEVDREAGEITLTAFTPVGFQTGIKASLRPTTEKEAEAGSWWWPEQVKADKETN